jgi:ribonuclease P protein component
LRQSREFSRLRVDGERITCGCLIMNWQLRPAGNSSRLGVITGKRIGGAVQRNHARRLLREAFRRNQPRLGRAADIVFVARHSISRCNFAAVEKDVLTALGRARLLTTTIPT